MADRFPLLAEIDRVREARRAAQEQVEKLQAEVARLERDAALVIVKHGQWYERGSMGWWGMVSNEKVMQMLDRWEEVAV